MGERLTLPATTFFSMDDSAEAGKFGKMTKRYVLLNIAAKAGRSAA